MPCAMLLRCTSRVVGCVRGQISKRLKDKYNCVPVFLPQKMAEQYYNGFSNDIVWPLFHYFPLPVGKHAQHFDHDLWEAYKAANRLFSETVRRRCWLAPLPSVFTLTVVCVCAVGLR